MKFGRYLAENLTPEWQRAYIDYRGCKKKIKVIQKRLGQIKAEAEDSPRRTESGAPVEDLGDDDDSSDNGDHGPSKAPKEAGGGTPLTRHGTSASRPTSTAGTVRSPGRTPVVHSGTMTTSPRNLNHTPPHAPDLDIGEPSVPPPHSPADATPRITRIRSHTRNVSFQPDLATRQATEREQERESLEQDKGVSDSSSLPGDSNGEDGPSSSRDPLARHQSAQDGTPPIGSAGQTPRMPFKSPRLNVIRNAFSPRQAPTESPSSGPRGPRSMRSMTLPSPMMSSRQSNGSIRTAKCFDDLYDSLQPDEKDFFDFLDGQVGKVETFYVARQNDAIRRAHELRSQLRELAEHRKLYHELYPEGLPQWEATVERYIPAVAVARSTNWSDAKTRMSRMLGVPEPGHATSNGQTALAGGKEGTSSHPTSAGEPTTAAAAREREALKQAMLADKDHVEYSPERYRKYKAELRKAVLEFYRQLELIKNYRIMNITGFRKALKKFEKVADVHCMELYTDDRIMPETFAQPDTIDKLLKETEELFSVHFEHGDAKKARDRLRRQDEPGHSHYMSTFRSGLYLGVGMSAAIVALVRANEPETQALIPNWDALLTVYGGIYIPVIFACLFELNLDAWVSARINYEFVMELTKPTLDYRSYLELPAFLFMTLSVCMYFSFHRIGIESVAPTTWPAAWLVFLAVFWLNPLPICRRRSRYWLLRVLFRVFTPGISRVEFIAFFLADELNSLVYSIQDIMFLSCAYGKGWPGDTFGVCPYASAWPFIFVSIIPALCRFIQCLKRYHDSKLTIHLVNAGKYTFTMLQYTFYILWRQSGSHQSSGWFISWIIIAFIYSSYNCSWDFVVDWSLLRPQSAGLRPDLGYSRRYLYYFAMVTNFLTRFYWVWYVPYPSRNRHLRSFILAMAEMLRRWQWNFFRVETEHLGNADAYRVTREIPLPYRRVDIDLDSDDEGQAAGGSAGSQSGKGGRADTRSGGSRSPLSVRLEKLKRSVVGSRTEGRGANALNMGARGHAGQREYEARRPGDTGLRVRSRSTIGDESREEV